MGKLNEESSAFRPCGEDLDQHMLRQLLEFRYLIPASEPSKDPSAHEVIDLDRLCKKPNFLLNCLRRSRLDLRDFDE